MGSIKQCTRLYAAIARRLLWIAAVSVLVSPVYAQQADKSAVGPPTSKEALRAELRSLIEAQQDLQMRITRLEQVLAADPDVDQGLSLDEVVDEQATTSELRRPGPGAKTEVLAAAPSERIVSPPPPLIEGDVRFRYEWNEPAGTLPERERFALRGRLALRYPATDWLMVGGRLVTGDTDDPNSSDVTLADFDDDLSVGLDQLYLALNKGPFDLHLGKFPQTLRRTDLVWDGDVNPEGISLRISSPVSGNVSLFAKGIYVVIDENDIGADSAMFGGQLSADFEAMDGQLTNRFSLAFYDYSVPFLGGADAGDIRSNLTNDTGALISDFDVIDALAGFTFRGFGENWPVSVDLNYAVNLGTSTRDNEGVFALASIGTLSGSTGLRVSYSYSEAGADAVLAAFSQDNIPLGTNYQLHSLGMDYAISQNVVVGGVAYRFRALDPGLESGKPFAGWSTRARFYLVWSF